MARDTRTVFERHRPDAGTVERSLAGSKHAVFWLEDAQPQESYPQLTADHETDLVIVGGGYLGLWSALLAKQREPGRRVTLLEGRTVGWAASGRNGGFCESTLTHGDENGANRWPDEMPTLRRLGEENLNEIEQAVAELSLDCEFERNGSLSVAVEPYQAVELQRHSSNYLDQDAVRALLNSPTYLAGELDSNGTALVHPARLAFELARAAVDLGVDIWENSRVTALNTRGAGVEVVTPYGRARAKQALLATNVFPSLLKRTTPLTVPVYDYVLMTEPLTDAQLAEIGWSGRQGVSDAANQFHYYRLSADNRILWGGYDAIFKRSVNPAHEDRRESYEKLAAHFFTTFPQLEDVRFSHRWAGAIDTSTRFCAFYGLAKGGRVAYSAGFTGMGVGATRFAANVLLDKLAGLTTERTQLAMVRHKPLPFPPEPVRTIGVETTRWSLDRADHHYGKRNLWLKTLDRLGLGFDS